MGVALAWLAPGAKGSFCETWKSTSSLKVILWHLEPREIAMPFLSLRIMRQLLVIPTRTKRWNSSSNSPALDKNDVGLVRTVFEPEALRSMELVGKMVLAESMKERFFFFISLLLADRDSKVSLRSLEFCATQV